MPGVIAVRNCLSSLTRVKELPQAPTYNLIVPRKEAYRKYNRDPEDQLRYYVPHDPYDPTAPLVLHFSMKELIHNPDGFVWDHYRTGRPLYFKVTFEKD